MKNSPKAIKAENNHPIEEDVIMEDAHPVKTPEKVKQKCKIIRKRINDYKP
jgi:hypothetical protein